jgi:hypothetical protein
LEHSPGSCRKHSETRLAKLTTDKLKKLEPGNSLSWVEIGNRVHEFASGGRRHPKREVICKQLEELIGQLEKMVYAPKTSLALHDIEEEHKKETLYHHSEMLALAFSIMKEGGLCCDGGVIRINKNIRICVDCHNFMKLGDCVGDSNRFHHFKDGLCSCSDYWQQLPLLTNSLCIHPMHQCCVPHFDDMNCLQNKNSHEN